MLLHLLLSPSIRVFRAMILLLCLPVLVNADEPAKDAAMNEAAARTQKLHKVPESMEALGDKLKEGYQISPQIKNLVQDAYDKTQTEAYQAKMKIMREMIYKDPESEQAGLVSKPGDRLYLFISSSVPVPVLRRYAKAIDNIPGAVLLMRGFIGGAKKVGPTMQFVAQVLRVDPNCTGAECPMLRVRVDIDPLLFRRYGIKQVPAMVIAEGVTLSQQCSEGNVEAASVDQWLKIFGDAPVDALLNRLAEEGTAPLIERFREQIKQGFFAGKKS